MFLYSSKHQQGNVLFLILIAVALFAALSFAISSSTRSNSQNPSKEQDAMTASMILQHGASIQSALLRLKITNECNDSSFSFANTTWKDFPAGNPSPAAEEADFPNAPVDMRCHVFQSVGGSVSPQNFLGAAITNQTFGSSMSGSPSVTYAVVPNVGTSAPEILMYVPHINRSICEEIYRKMDMTLSGWGFGGIPHGTCTFAGYQNAGVNFPTSPACNANTAGLKTWCATDTNNNAAHLYYVILER